MEKSELKKTRSQNEYLKTQMPSDAELQADAAYLGLRGPQDFLEVQQGQQQLRPQDRASIPTLD